MNTYLSSQQYLTHVLVMHLYLGSATPLTELGSSIERPTATPTVRQGMEERTNKRTNEAGLLVAALQHCTGPHVSMNLEPSLRSPLPLCRLQVPAQVPAPLGPAPHNNVRTLEGPRTLERPSIHGLLLLLYLRGRRGKKGKGRPVDIILIHLGMGLLLRILSGGNI